MELELNQIDQYPQNYQYYYSYLDDSICLIQQPETFQNETTNTLNSLYTESHHFMDTMNSESSSNKENENEVNNKNISPKTSFCSIADISNVISNCSQYSDMRLFGDLSVSADGILRLCSVLSNVNLGYFPSDCDQVSYLKTSQIFNLRFLPITQIQKFSTLDALKLIRQLPEAMAVLDVLKNMDRREQTIKQLISEMNVSDKFIEQKNQQFEVFTAFCFDYLNKYYGNCMMNEAEKKHNNGDAHNISNGNNQQSTCSPPPSYYYSGCWQGASVLSADKCYAENSQMFTYAIGRINLEKSDIDIHNAGYSASFLQLLGLDQDSLATIQLRRKKIDLIPDKREIIRQTLNGINQRSQENYNPDQAYNVADIVTFDGFPLRIYRKTFKMAVPEQFKSCLTQRSEYIFLMNVIDVDLDQLQNLIVYRQNINEKQSIEAFIQKELSYRFEDVEYSIHSENFLNKFYAENIKALKRMERLKYPCKYRFIR